MLDKAAERSAEDDSLEGDAALRPWDDGVN
jgi:hypothetical protein